MTDPTAPQTVTYVFKADTEHMRRSLESVGQQGIKVGNVLSNALAGVAVRGESLGDVLRGLVQSLSQMALRAAFRPLDQAFGSLVNGFASLGGPPGGGGNFLPTGTPLPFARGGVIAAPHAFPLGGGRTGIAGEAGPEAILPLTRGPDGRLGVAASGSPSPGAITINITTPDIESFRRSETQVAAQLARAVALGQRNL